MANIYKGFSTVGKVRTPNTQPNPDDYEVSIGFSNDHYYVNRQWERELGEKYIDDLFWAKFDNGVYLKPEYMDKQSQDVKYLKLDWRRSWKGVSAGLTTRSTTDELNEYDTFVSVGWDKKKTYSKKVDVELSFALLWKFGYGYGEEVLRQGNSYQRILTNKCVLHFPQKSRGV